MNASAVLNTRHSYDMGKHPVRPHIRAGQPVSGHQRSTSPGVGQSAEVDSQAHDAARQAATSADQAADADDGIDRQKTRGDIAADVNLLTHGALGGDDIPWPVTEDSYGDLTESLNRPRLGRLARRYRQFQVGALMAMHEKCQGLLAVKECADTIDQGGAEKSEIARLVEFVDEHWDGAWNYAGSELRDLYTDVMFDIHSNMAAELVENGHVEQDAGGKFCLRDRDAARAYIERIADE